MTALNSYAPANPIDSKAIAKAIVGKQ